jgi:diguanylate cyclase (GGDEF)-like protein
MTSQTTSSPRDLKARFGAIFGVRARITFLVMILAVPLMLHRVMTLEDSRANQIRSALTEIAELARRGADAHQSVIGDVEMSLKAMAELYVASARLGNGCDFLPAAARIKPPGPGHVSVAAKSGRVLCSTLPGLVGLDVTDRPYFHQALLTGQFTLSDYLVLRARNNANLIGAIPTSFVDEKIETVIITSIDINWINRVLTESNSRISTKAFLIDGSGTVIATSAGIEDWIGNKAPEGFPLRVALSEERATIDSASFGGSPQFISFLRVPQTAARFVIAVDKAAVLGRIDRDVRNAYVQFVLLTLIGLLGAWFASELLMVRPLRVLTNAAMKFGRGDFTTRVKQDGLPAEFEPLIKAFNGMASRLSEREREMVAANTRLTVLASVDAVSGLANRHGFDNRLDAEWLRAQETQRPLGALMIDVDHFKQYNDRYGHPEGDVCLRRIGDLLAHVAADTNGFAARYGGEEFLVLLPGTDADDVTAIGERICAMVQGLKIPHLVTDIGVVTVSVGATTVTPEHGQRPARLINAADAGLYAAKRRGRNQVVTHGPLEPVPVSTSEIVFSN